MLSFLTAIIITICYPLRICLVLYYFLCIAYKKKKKKVELHPSPTTKFHFPTLHNNYDDKT